MKCFSCIAEEYNKKIKWSKVEEGLCIFEGKSYCYKHLCRELNWKYSLE